MRKLYYAALALLVVAGCEDKTEIDLTARPAVYTMTNANTNAIVIFQRASDGTLTRGKTIATGGSGLGTELESQYSLRLSDDRRFLFAANAGSDDITVFRVVSDSLIAVQRIGSGGDRPISIASRGNLVYVLNAGNGGNIVGFAQSTTGELSPLNVTRTLSGSPGSVPAAIDFSQDGSLLVVTEPDADVLDVFVVNAQGAAGQAIAQPSIGDSPFGLTFTRNDQLIVANAGFDTGFAELTAFNVSAAGALAFVDSVRTNQVETTHVIVNNAATAGYASNRGSNSISGFSLSTNGVFTSLNANGVTATTGNRPEDLALSSNGQFLYVLNTGDNTISSFRVNSNGTLTALATAANSLPASSYGLAAF